VDYLEHVSNAGAGVVRSGCSNQAEHVLKHTRPARQQKRKDSIIMSEEKRRIVIVIYRSSGVMKVI
jgi:hypothetical protein